MQKDLEQFIRDLKDKSDIRYDEANTKSFIIERVLTHLKWDVHSPDDIAREQGRKKKIDYELKASNIDIGIEAKAIKQSLSEDDGKQLLGYCGDSHILAILTNGKDWWFYLPQAEGGPSRKRFYMMDIFQDPSNAASKFIDLLSKDNIINGDAIENAKSMYRGQRSEIKKLKLEIAKIEKEQDYLSVDNDFTKKSIQSFYFNGSKYDVQSWKDLLVGILDIIYSIHRKDFDKVLGVTGGHGRLYFSKNPDEVKSPLKIKDTGIYVDTKLSANNIAQLCQDIIYEFGYSDNDLRIKISSGEIEKIVEEKGEIKEKTKLTAKPIDNDIADQRQGMMIAQPIDEDLSEKDKRERYGEYSLAIQRILPDIKKMISSNKGKEIKFRTTDIAKDLGEDFIDKNPTTIYWGLKYVLFKERIVVDSSTRSGEKFLVMRNATPDDKLPPSLAKYLEPDDISRDVSEGIKKKMSSGELRDMLKDLPTPLGHTLEVYYCILDGLTRIDATNFVAKRKDVTSSTISSSYTRSLEKSTSEIDILMQPENNKKFKNILIDKFPEHVDKINEFFNNI